jgi:Tfp pilus assembly PilM family ATPase
MPIFHNHVGINLTETKLQLVEITHKQNAFCLENIDQSIFKDTLMPDIKESNLINILQDSFSKLYSKKPIISNYVSFCLPNNFFKISEIPYDYTLTKKDLQEQLKWEISILFPMYESDSFLFQYIEVNKSSVRRENKIVVFALEKRIVNSLNSFCKQNNLILKYVDNAHLASNAFLHLMKDDASKSATYSFYIDQHHSSLAVFDGIHPFYYHVFNSNGNNFFDNLNESIAKINTMKIQNPEQRRITMSGQTVPNDFVEKISKVFNTPVVKVNPFDKLKIEESVKTNPLYLSQYNSFTAATGIAIRII